MGIRFYKPTSPGRRGASVSDFADLTDKKKKPEKSLMKRLTKSSGRNNQGKITARHRGGGARKMYRVIDFRRIKDGVPATVVSIEYDPNRSARIALILYADNEKSYILAPLGMKAGDVVRNGPGIEPNVGNCLPLSDIPTGTEIHNIEMRPGKGGQLVRSAGLYATLNARDGKWAQVTLPSGEVRRVHSACRATIGKLSFPEHSSIVIGKAGRNRWKGIRPHVRGVVMNPISHPMGGGEGRSSGGRHPCSPTGVLAKGGKTRNPRKNSGKAIIRRRRSVRYGQLKV